MKCEIYVYIFFQNLLKYRHPYIVRYISAWQQRSTFHLATEYVQPLAHVLDSQTPLQICIGLNNVLQALVFLHEQVSHFEIIKTLCHVTVKLKNLNLFYNFLGWNVT